MHTFAFESYGARIRIDSNRKRIITRVRTITNRSLLGKFVEIDPDSAEHGFKILKRRTVLSLEIDGSEVSETPSSKVLFKYFESRLRLMVAEFAKDFVFIHAGVIGWKGKAVLFPADSFQGKTTLVAALAKRGAVYYSDDFAILDKNGMVHPFARPLSIRVTGRSEIRANRSVSSLGGVAGEIPLPVGVVILTKFISGSKWDPKILTSGNGLLEMIRQTIPLRSNPEFSLLVLKNVVNHAIIAETPRSEIGECAHEIINFIDKRLF